MKTNNSGVLPDESWRNVLSPSSEQERQAFQHIYNAVQGLHDFALEEGKSVPFTCRVTCAMLHFRCVRLSHKNLMPSMAERWRAWNYFAFTLCGLPRNGWPESTPRQMKTFRARVAKLDRAVSEWCYELSHLAVRK